MDKNYDTTYDERYWPDEPEQYKDDDEEPEYIPAWEMDY
jgi:hypothetical protein